MYRFTTFKFFIALFISFLLLFVVDEPKNACTFEFWI